MTPTTQTTEAGTAGTTPAAAQRTFIPVERGGGRVDSETGTLREVIVHRPGREIARVTPINANDLLFDDALNIRRAQAEHSRACPTSSSPRSSWPASPAPSCASA